MGPFGASALRLLGLMAQVAGWRPGEFWDATPADAAAVLAAWLPDAGAEGMDRGRLAAMMEQFPDG